jgi:hypothetical protein
VIHELRSITDDAACHSGRSEGGIKVSCEKKEATAPDVEDRRQRIGERELAEAVVKSFIDVASSHDTGEAAPSSKH